MFSAYLHSFLFTYGFHVLSIQLRTEHEGSVHSSDQKLRDPNSFRHVNSSGNTMFPELFSFKVQSGSHLSIKPMYILLTIPSTCIWHIFVL